MQNQSSLPEVEQKKPETYFKSFGAEVDATSSEKVQHQESNNASTFKAKKKKKKKVKKMGALAGVINGMEDKELADLQK